LPSFVEAFSISTLLLTILPAFLNAPTRDIDCSSSILGSDIECAEISKLPNVFFKPPKRRRGKDRPSSDEAGAGAARASDENRMFIGAMRCVFSWPYAY
jgi:hypothetical protein